MASDELKSLIALKRAHPYDPEQSIESLRGTGPDPGSIPRPDTKVTPLDAHGVYAEWVVCGEAKTECVFMFLHGGGYYRSSAVATRMLASNLSAACGCRCFTVDYRLAPECPFPAALEDAFAAYQWLLEQGLEAAQIVVGGSSAGGGLAAALLNKLKETGVAMPAAAILLSPWTDLTQSVETFETNAALDPSISKAYLDRMAGLYLKEVDPKNPLASPVYATLDGLPPILVQVGKDETMCGDAQAYAAKALEAGVQITLEVYDDVIHGWHNTAHIVPEMPEAIRAFKQIGEFIKARLG